MTATATGLAGSGDVGGGGTFSAPGLRDFTNRGLWARLTAEPRAGWYSWRTAVPKSDGGWAVLPATADFPYGTAGSTAAADSLPARGANAEAGLKTGTDDGLVVWLEFDPVTPGYRFDVGGGSRVAVLATAANTGSQWTAGQLLAFSPATGESLPSSPPEVVDLKPLDTSEPLANGKPYLALDTGARSPGTNRRRFRTERAPTAGGGPGTITDVQCINGNLAVIRA